MKVTARDRQSLVDLALQTSGGVEAALALSIKYDIPVSAPLAPGAEFETAPLVDKLVLNRYTARRVRPATEVTPAEMEQVGYVGIGFMGIEIDFTVS